MSAGELRERVRFERRIAVASDGAGNSEGEWTELCTVAAQVAPLVVRAVSAEIILAGRLSGHSYWTIKVRDSSLTRGIAPGDRAVNVRTDAVFNVRSTINFDQKRQYISMDAELGVAT